MEREFPEQERFVANAIAHDEVPESMDDAVKTLANFATRVRMEHARPSEQSVADAQKYWHEVYVINLYDALKREEREKRKRRGRTRQ